MAATRTSGQNTPGDAGWRARWADRCWSAGGQTTTEWLMVAGALTAVGIFLLNRLPFTIRQFCQALVWSLRTIAG